jgi:hypothetical protein
MAPGVLFKIAKQIIKTVDGAIKTMLFLMVYLGACAIKLFTVVINSES